MNSFTFKDGDLSQYNVAGRPYCQLESNGKVDLEPKKNGIIGFSEKGMFHLTKAWLETYTPMNEEHKKELIDLLKNK